MIPFVNYMMEANLGLILFFALYYLMLHNETDFKLQRFYILAGIFASLLFPLITLSPGIRFRDVPSLSQMLPELIVGNATQGTINPLEPSGSYFFLAGAVYVLVCTFLVLFFSLQITKMLKFLKKGNGKYYGDHYVIESTEEFPSFSFFRLIFLGQTGRLAPTEKKYVLEHELAHSRRLHSFDILLLSLLAILFWFNPIVWLLKRTLVRVHEFEVDAAMVEDQRSFEEYSELLVREALTRSGYLFAHHFNQSFTLKRIEMMKTLKKKTRAWKLITSLIVAASFFFVVSCQDQLDQTVSELKNSDFPANVPERVKTKFSTLKAAYPSSEFVLLLLNDEGKQTMDKLHEMVGGSSDKALRLTFVYPDPESNEQTDTYAIIEIGQKLGSAKGPIYNEVDETATPLSGLPEFYKYVSQNLFYPLKARQMGIEGKVYIEFTVNEDGKLSDFQVLRGIGAGCDDEALRVMMQSQPWHPGKHEGKYVKQKMVLPITFKLN